MTINDLFRDRASSIGGVYIHFDSIRTVTGPSTLKSKLRAIFQRLTMNTQRQSRGVHLTFLCLFLEQLRALNSTLVSCQGPNPNTCESGDMGLLKAKVPFLKINPEGG